MRGSRGARAPGCLCHAARCHRDARPATSACRSSNSSWWRGSLDSSIVTETKRGETVTMFPRQGAGSPARVLTNDALSACRVSADLLGQPDENALGASDVAEPIHVFVLDHFVDELRAVSVEPGERIVEVVHGEH